MTTYLRLPPPQAKPPGTPSDADCPLAREVKGRARVFIERPWAQQLVLLVRLRLPFTRQQLWQFRAELPRDFHTRDLLAAAESAAVQLYGAQRTRKARTNRQR